MSSLYGPPWPMNRDTFFAMPIIQEHVTMLDQKGKHARVQNQKDKCWVTYEGVGDQIISLIS